MTMGSKQLEDFTRVLIDVRLNVNSFQTGIDKILTLLIPTLNWKDNTNVSFSTGGGKMCVIRKTDETYTTTMPVGFTGTLDECKHYCSVWVRDEYLKLCGNGQNA